MRIFLTGATGYLGGALARRLAADGHEVRALVRPGRDLQALVNAGVTPCTGDIADRASMREGMSGADWVIHAAAYVELEGPREAMERVNVQGSENVASLAHKLGVGRFLSVSSIAQFGGSPEDGSAGHESSPVLRPFPSLYSETKHAGQERIRQWTRQGLALNTVFPSLIYGPPGKRLGSNAVLRTMALGRFPALVGGDRKTSWVFLDDVVEAMLRIVTQAPAGRDYVLAGEITTVRDLTHQVCRLAGVKPPRLELPLALARAAVALGAPLAKLFGARPPLTPGQLASLSRHWAFDDTRARQELGWAPRPLAEGLPPTVEFLLRP